VADLSGVRPFKGEELTIRGRSTEVLRQLILDGQLKPGSRLNEVELAASLGISRGPLREAIQRLSAEGLITSVSHRGAFVRKFAPGEISALFELRSILEIAAARIAAQRCTEQDILELRQLLTETADAFPDGEGPYPEFPDFHVALVDRTHNPALARAARDVFQGLQLARTMGGSRPPRARAAFAEHIAIVDAVAAGDDETVANLMQTHIADAGNIIFALFEGDGDNDRTP